MVNPKQINIFKLKSILQKKGYKISKKHKIISESFFSFYYTALAGILLIFSFYAAPIVFSYTSKILTKNKVVINTSNKNFNRVLEGKKLK